LKDYGTLLNYPAFTKPRPDVGYVTRYAPGLRENGGVYTHAATWSVWAYTLAGQPELAYEAYRKICPPNRSTDIETYKAEPYVTPGNVDGPLSEYYGRGGIQALHSGCTGWQPTGFWVSGRRIMVYWWIRLFRQPGQASK
jgi:cellobiose phosphorylase